MPINSNKSYNNNKSKLGMGLNITLTEVGVKTCSLRLAYLKTIQAILKIIELIIAITLIGIVAHYFTEGYTVSGDLFFLLIIVTFFICSFCLFISEWIVWSTVESSSKSVFEIIFFAFMLILMFASSVNLFVNVVTHYDNSHDSYIPYIISSILEFILMALYTTDIVLSLCLNSCRKKTPTKSPELNS